MNPEKILATVSAPDLIGRTREIETLLQHAASENRSSALLLLSAPGLGVSEILRQTYDRLFLIQENTVPIYLSLKKTYGGLKQLAKGNLRGMLRQFIAFRRKDPRILDFSGDFDELAQLAIPSDGHWIDRMIETISEADASDERAFLRNCLSAPLRALRSGTRMFVMFDDADDDALVEEIKEIFAGADISFVLAGRRRFLLNAAQTGNTRLDDAEILRLEPLSFGDAGLLAENLSRSYDVKINEQTRDLIAVQFDGNPTFINFLFQAASDQGKDLNSFQRVEQVYADEIFGGRIAKFYASVFDEISADVETQKNIVGLLYDALTIAKEKTPVDAWQKRLGLSDEDFHRAIAARLNTQEIIRLTSNLVEVMSENEILTDYLRGRFRLESAAENRALVVGEFMGESLKRAPQTMAKFYRRSSAIGLRELLSVFDCQETPAALLDYAKFKEKYKGADEAEMLDALSSETEKIVLPQIVYTAHTVAFYPPIEQVTEKERSAVALGFEESKYTEEDETVWIAAEIDSKLEAAPELTEFWCDRLEMVALVCNFPKYKLWLIAPEGFSPEALEILESRNALGSSKKQVELLVNFLNAQDLLNEKPKADEFEMVIPMGEDTEMIAVHAVEEIARRHHFPPKAITQIKTALVEACINAAEHSHSPDRKIYLKFAVDEEKIVIIVSNRGLRLTDKNAQEIAPDAGRRGEGLKLMRMWMDEVKIEQVDDGTRISMTKYLKADLS